MAAPDRVVNWQFALGVAAFGGLLGGIAFWMLHAALYPAPPKQRTRSDSEQQ